MITRSGKEYFVETESTDAELVRAIRAGDTRAAGMLWQRHCAIVHTAIRRLLGHDPEVEDIAQQVFLAFLQSIDTLRDASSVRAFLFGIAKRLVLFEIRCRRRERRLLSLFACDRGGFSQRPADSESAEALRVVERALQRMPPRRRNAFVLRQVDGFELVDAARALGVSHSTVKREVVRARESIDRSAQSDPALSQYLIERPLLGHRRRARSMAMLSTTPSQFGRSALSLAGTRSSSCDYEGSAA